MSVRTRPIPALSDAQKQAFWSKVAIRAGCNYACWEWTGSCNSLGYGWISLDRKTYQAHRIAMSLVTEIPDGMYVCHHCDNPICVNPAHLWIGTSLDNMRDMRHKKREKHSGAINPCKGSLHCRAKLTESDIPIIRQVLEYLTHRMVADLYDVSRGAIGDIKQGITWKHV